MTQAPAKRGMEYKWIVMLIVMIGMVMSALDASIVNVSIPKIMADFGSNITDIEWVLTAYMLAYAVLMPLTAWARDRIGHKILFTLSLVVFTLGSILCGFAVNLPTLIAARVLQALGGGAMVPTGMAMVAEVFDPKERGSAMGYFGLAFIVGPAFGPTLGGWLTEAFGWRSIFLVNLPIGIIGILMALELLVNDRPHGDKHRPFDFLGFLLLSVFLITFLLGVSRGETEGWTSRYILTCLALSVFSFVAFLVTESLVKDKIMDLGLFRYAVFSVSMLLTAIRSVALFGSIFLLPLFLQQLMGFSAVQSGLILLPGSLMVAVCLPFVGRLINHSSPRFLAVVGIILLGLSIYPYGSISIYNSAWDIIWPSLIRGVGLAFLFAPISTLAINAVPRQKAGMASSMMSIIQQVGGAVGIAILSTVLDNRIKFHMSTVGPTLDSSSPAFQTALHSLAYRAHDLGLGLANSFSAAQGALMQRVYIAQSSFGFQDAFLFALMMVVLSLIPTFLLPNHNVIHKEDPDLEPPVLLD